MKQEWVLARLEVKHIKGNRKGRRGRMNIYWSLIATVISETHFIKGEKKGLGKMITDMCHPIL